MVDSPFPKTTLSPVNQYQQLVRYMLQLEHDIPKASDALGVSRQRAIESGAVDFEYYRLRVLVFDGLNCLRDIADIGKFGVFGHVCCRRKVDEQLKTRLSGLTSVDHAVRDLMCRRGLPATFVVSKHASGRDRAYEMEGPSSTTS